MLCFSFDHYLGGRALKIEQKIEYFVFNKEKGRIGKYGFTIKGEK